MLFTREYGVYVAMIFALILMPESPESPAVPGIIRLLCCCFQFVRMGKAAKKQKKNGDFRESPSDSLESLAIPWNPR